MTRQVRLRPVEPDDVPIFFQQQADVQAAVAAAVPSRKRADHEAHWVKILADPDVLIRTILTPSLTPTPTPERADEVVAGNVLSFVRDGRREVGYWLGRAFWGHGIATAALRLFLEEYRVRPLVACVASGNGPSATVLLHNGFRETATVVTDGVTLRTFALD